MLHGGETLQIASGLQARNIELRALGTDREIEPPVVHHSVRLQVRVDRAGRDGFGAQGKVLRAEIEDQRGQVPARKANLARRRQRAGPGFCVQLVDLDPGGPHASLQVDLPKHRLIRHAQLPSGQLQLPAQVVRAGLTLERQYRPQLATCHCQARDQPGEECEVEVACLEVAAKWLAPFPPGSHAQAASSSLLGGDARLPGLGTVAPLCAQADELHAVNPGRRHRHLGQQARTGDGAGDLPMPRHPPLRIHQLGECAGEALDAEAGHVHVEIQRPVDRPPLGAVPRLAAWNDLAMGCQQWLAMHLTLQRNVGNPALQGGAHLGREAGQSSPAYSGKLAIEVEHGLRQIAASVEAHAHFPRLDG